MPNRTNLLEALKQKWLVLSTLLDERGKRLWAATEAQQIGWGGVSLLSEATGMMRKTISKGIRELSSGVPNKGRVRSEGGGRKSKKELLPDLVDQFELLVQPHTKGYPMRALRWTSKSTYKLSEQLQSMGYGVSARTVGRLLKEQNYSLQLNRKEKESNNHKDRDAQFNFINDKVASFLHLGKAAISVDTKKKENIGNYKNSGREYHKKGNAPKVKVHDFKDKKLGKVAPYGIYDIAINKGWVSVGISSDTAEFAVNSIRNWWYQMGAPLYNHTSEILITADGEGSNSSRSRLWKVQLQQLSNEINKTIHICHFRQEQASGIKLSTKCFASLQKTGEANL